MNTSTSSTTSKSTEVSAPAKSIQEILNSNRKPTRYKTIICEKYKIKAYSVAGYLGLSYPYTVNLLNGRCKLTAKVKSKLDALVAELKGGCNE